MNIVIVGHIDHGKSTLIGRLLFDTKSLPESVLAEASKNTANGAPQIEFAYLVDSLEEERLQNITIDTTQTFFKTDKRRYAIIDAPGHKEFLRNMVSGASRADAAILVVDIGRGMEEQSRRHAYVLKLLGIEQVIVAVNKMDLVGYSKDKYEQMKSEITSFFNKLQISPRKIVPISAAQGDNIIAKCPQMSWYDGLPILTELDNLNEDDSESCKGARFVVQAPFKDKNTNSGNTVYLGRVESGSLKVGDSFISLPEKKTVQVKSIYRWPNEIQKAEAGESVAISLDASVELNRGSTICSEPLPKLVNELNATVFSLTTQKIDKDQELSIRCATQIIPCKISRIKNKVNSATLEQLGSDCKEISEAEVAEVVITSEQPLAVDTFQHSPPFGRFVLAQDGNIIAAGIVPEV